MRPFPWRGTASDTRCGPTPGGCQPVAIFSVLSLFIVYATWAALQGNHYTYGPYLSPFYSPELFGSSPHAWFGPKPGWWPGWLVFSPALLILWAPGGFRVTCYYYRGAYYKAFWADPLNCAVGEPRNRYPGEQRFPLILQNVHRYFLYLAVLFLASCCTTCGRRCGLPDADGVTAFRHRRRHAGARGQRRPPRRLHARLPFAAPPGGRDARPAVGPPRARRGVRLRDLSQPPSSSSGRGSLLMVPFCDSLRPAVLDGDLARLENLLMADVRGLRARRAGDRRRRRRAARGHRPRRPGCHGGPGLQVAARQGAHRDGRGRHRGGAGQRR